jgi:hypothetical protein
MEKKASARENYRNAAEASKNIEKTIDTFLMKRGSQYPIESPKESDISPFGKPDENVPDGIKRLREEMYLQREVIGRRD